MNAVEFVKKHGWEEAKKFLNLPSYTIDQLLMLQSGLRCNELQKLVDSWELVESWGGLEDAKLYDLSPCEKKPESAGYKLKKTITDVERVGGGV